MVSDSRTDTATAQPLEADPRDPRAAASPSTPSHAAAASESWAAIDKLVRELIEYVSYYVSVRADRIRFGLLRTIVMLLLGCTAALLGAALISAAGVLLLVGAGQGLGEAFGGRLWLGNMVAGAAFLVVVGAAVFIASRRIVRSATFKTVHKYAERLQRQRREFGRDLRGRTR